MTRKRSYASAGKTEMRQKTNGQNATRNTATIRPDNTDTFHGRAIAASNHRASQLSKLFNSQRLFILAVQPEICKLRCRVLLQVVSSWAVWRARKELRGQ